MSYEIIVGLPAYNEETALPLLFEKLKPVRETLGERLEVFVVNDGSSDRTEAILKDYASRFPYIRYMNHDRNRGLGAAMSTLISYAAGKYDDDSVLLTLDADNTHNPSVMLPMLELLNSRNLDVVIASRFAKGGREIGVPLYRKLYSRGAMIFFKVFFPISNVRDYSCGFRAYSVGYLKKALSIYGGSLISTSGFDCMAEILARFSRIGVRAGEYPLVLEYNLKEGRSKMKIMKTILGYFGLLERIRKPVRE